MFLVGLYCLNIKPLNDRGKVILKLNNYEKIDLKFINLKIILIESIFGRSDKPGQSIITIGIVCLTTKLNELYETINEIRLGNLIQKKTSFFQSL